MSEQLQILTGDCRETLKTLPDASVQCCVTSPPYFGLRDYGHAGQLGLEPTPDEYVANMVAVFREVRRVLREDGVLWLNLGDSYNSAASGQNGTTGTLGGGVPCGGAGTTAGRRAMLRGIKPKDLIGIPWRVAFALQADGWYLRQDIIWHKPNPMPESVTDRCTKAHEYVFLMSKSARYYFDAKAISEMAKPESAGRYAYEFGGPAKQAVGKFGATRPEGKREFDGTRNRRSVWTIATSPYKGAHFATFPQDLVKPCILAGCPVGGTVLDPFGGSGTTGLVANMLGRKAVLCELNPKYVELMHERRHDTAPLLLAS